MTRAIVKYSVALFLLTALAYVGAAPPPAPANNFVTAPLPVPQGSSVGTVPLQQWHGLIVTEMGEAGVPLPLAVATTLNACTLSPAASQTLHAASITGSAAVELPDQRIQSAPLVQLKRLSAGTLLLGPLQAALLDPLKTLAPALAIRPDAPQGWLGSPFLNTFQIKILYQQGLLTLASADAPMPKGKDILIVPFLIEKGLPMVQVHMLGGKPFAALLDTAAPVTILPAGAALQAKLKSLGVFAYRREDGSMGRAVQCQAPSLSVGRAEVKDATAAWIETNAAGKKEKEPLPRIGNDFLRHFDVTISWKRKQIAFAPSSAAFNPSLPDKKP